MRWIYVSPHFDDAVLSCGGLIWEQTHQGVPVEIWTVNAGDPLPGEDSDFIIRTHAMWNTGTPQETIDLRRIEDRNAAGQVGASIRHLKMVDAIYRRDATGNLLYTKSVFVPIDPREPGIIEQVADQIGASLYPDDILVCPLSLGGHVDHVITRQAVERLRPAGSPLWYYADIPYLFNHEQELAPAVKNLLMKNHFISDQGLAAWQAGIEEYQSQLASLFEDATDMRNKLKNYLLERDGQDLWGRA